MSEGRRQQRSGDTHVRVGVGNAHVRVGGRGDALVPEGATLTLAELESAACALASVFLGFLDTRVAG